MPGTILGLGDTTVNNIVFTHRSSPFNEGEGQKTNIVCEVVTRVLWRKIKNCRRNAKC